MHNMVEICPKVTPFATSKLFKAGILWSSAGWEFEEITMNTLVKLGSCGLWQNPHCFAVMVLEMDLHCHNRWANRNHNPINSKNDS